MHVPTAAEVEDMSLEERARPAVELDDVCVVHNLGHPVPDAHAGTRIERAVTTLGRHLVLALRIGPVAQGR